MNMCAACFSINLRDLSILYSLLLYVFKMCFQFIEMCRDVQREITRIAATTAGKSGVGFKFLNLDQYI